MRRLGPCRICLYRVLTCPRPRLVDFMEMKEAGRVLGSGCQRVEADAACTEEEPERDPLPVLGLGFPA